MVTDGWTLDELVRRVANALAADDVRAPNGRVRDVPDARAIRWYTTIGLVDRPSNFRGRTALYGPRHLLQAVAVKRRQAGGLPLARIQAELAGATDATLRRVARIPEALLAPPVAGGARPPAPGADAPPAPRVAVAPIPEVAAPRAPYVPTPAPSVTTPAPSVTTPAPPAATPAPPGHGVPPAPGDVEPPVPGSAPAEHRHRFWAAPPVSAPAPVAALRYRVALARGVALELPVAPSPRDLADITAATAPLIRFLAERGLLTPEESSE